MALTMTKTLNDGTKIPVYGFGTFQIPADGSTYKAVREALDLGIRHIDTAVAYFNEQAVGDAIRAAEQSLERLGTDSIDLMLLHQPMGDYINAWRGLEKLYKYGKSAAQVALRESPAWRGCNTQNRSCRQNEAEHHWRQA